MTVSCGSASLENTAVTVSCGIVNSSDLVVVLLCLLIAVTVSCGSASLLVNSSDNILW